jgi:phage recombination protein Bet
MTEHPGHALAITRPAREAFAPAQVKIIKDTVAVGTTDAEFHLFLEICARYELNPLTGEAYCMKIPGKNGDRGRMVPVVGRNGWLKIARRNPDFVRVDSDVVREKDHFKVVRKDGKRTIEHAYEGTEAQRGPILGAWAEVIRRDADPTYAYCPIAEYKPGGAKLTYSPWSSQESVMMKKCAIIVALRETYSMAGVYDEAEMHRVTNFAEESRPRLEGPEIDFGPDPEIAGWLQRLAEEANRVEPGSWLPGRLALKLEGCDEEGRVHVAQEMAAFIQRKGGNVPEREVIEEAEVVAS